jgi:hypothetical protein
MSVVWLGSHFLVVWYGTSILSECLTDRSLVHPLTSANRLSSAAVQPTTAGRNNDEREEMHYPVALLAPLPKGQGIKGDAPVAVQIIKSKQTPVCFEQRGSKKTAQGKSLMMDQL